MTFLFIATIGPVQPFIASARRTRDLYVGSMLLSELSKAAARKIAERVGQQNLVFPAPERENDLVPNSSFNVANKLVAVVEDPKTLDTLGEDVRQAIQDRLNQVRDEAFSEQSIQNKDGVPKKIELATEAKANAQLENLVEYFWVAVPFEDVNAYANARKRAEALLGARKNTQFFRAASWGEDYVPKSSIDGQRECVIPLSCYPVSRSNDNVQARLQTKRKAKLLYDLYKAGPHERLSAVDLIKRLGLKSMHETVLSTSHIAAMPFLDCLDEKLDENEIKDAKALWDIYIRQIEKLASSSIVEYRAGNLTDHPVIGNNDGALLFKERLLDDTEYIDELTDAYDALKNFFDFTDKPLGGLRPSPYYALLLADGDGMGKAIDNQAKGGSTEHRAISQALTSFAHQVRDLVDKNYGGSLVYAGGDDVLALLPLHKVLECARKLHETFDSKLKSFQDKKGNPPTLSVGIAVVHHVSLLQDALDLARVAEKDAKGNPGKDALAIIVKKRGGEQNKVVVSWDDEEERLSLLVALYRADIIPAGMAYELRTMMERLNASFKHPDQETDQEIKTRVELQEIIQLEAARILRRKLYFSRERMKQADYQDIETIMEKHLTLTEISEAMRKGLKTPQDRARYLLLHQIAVLERPAGGFEVLPSENITTFVDALIVAQTFAEALKPTPTKGFAE